MDTYAETLLIRDTLILELYKVKFDMVVNVPGVLVIVDELRVEAFTVVELTLMMFPLSAVMVVIFKVDELKVEA